MKIDKANNEVVAWREGIMSKDVPLFAILQEKIDCLAISSHYFTIHDMPVARSIGKMVATACTLYNVRFCAYIIFHYIVNVHITHHVMS